MKTLVCSSLLVSALFSGGVQAALPDALKTKLNAEVIEGRIKISAPNLAENGGVVPVKISQVDVPGDAKVREIAFYSDNNTTCPIARYTLSPRMLSEGIGTRIKLARTTNIYALATLDDGRILTGEKQVKVTIGGCGGGADLPNFSAMNTCEQK
jgi:sulfur-oxidizing protein SoxY